MNSEGKAALLWDESFLWGLMLFRALKRQGLAFDLVRSEEVRQGALASYRALVVPGGWASNKIKALQPAGVEAVKGFVAGGGSYFGICGGAGLAVADSIGLLDVSRRKLAERVPSLSGEVVVGLAAHPLWHGIQDPTFTVWWPSQFLPGPGCRSLARFVRATGDAYSADLNVGDMPESGWQEAEELYGINLQPEKMADDPLVLEGTYGPGRVILSLLHFDTPGSASGARALANLWSYLGLGAIVPDPAAGGPAPRGAVYDTVRDLHLFGLRNFLWFERSGLIQWRRGIRGLEYHTLYALVAELASLGAGEELRALGDEIAEFVRLAKRLLILERLALQRGETITFARTKDEEIKTLRARMFADSKSYGGWFKSLLDRLDAALYQRLKGQETHRSPKA